MDDINYYFRDIRSEDCRVCVCGAHPARLLYCRLHVCCVACLTACFRATIT